MGHIGPAATHELFTMGGSQLPMGLEIGQKIEATMHTYAMPEPDLRWNVVGQRVGESSLRGIVTSLPTHTEAGRPVSTILIDQGEGQPTFVAPLDVIHIPQDSSGKRRLARFAVSKIDETIAEF